MPFRGQTLNREGIPSLSSFVRVHQDRITGGSILLGPEIALELTESGAEILSMCDGQRTLEAISQTLAAEYDAPLEDILEDAIRFLNRLVDKGYVRWTEKCT